jgi:hypothetical protein
MEDIRTRVGGESNVFESIQKKIPGFKGYKEKEQIRESDRILRGFLADKLRAIRASLEGIRDLLTEQADLANVGKVQSAIDNLDFSIEKVAHAEAGYAGLFDAVKVKEDALNRLYDYDNSLFIKLPQIEASVAKAKNSVMVEESDRAEMTNTVLLVKDFNKLLDERKNVMLGISV